jgi:hypothetical protein
MNGNVIPLAQIQDIPDTTILQNGDHRASAAATRIGRDAREIERLPFDLSVIENEGIFIVRRATYY